ncbi:MAG: coproporphyrinogen-III oxidase family protein, partial [Candidatus Polarisedimenticolia bacterium]
SLAPGAEIGLEANPEDVTRDRVSALLYAGLTRLTVGVQSLDDDRLRLLRRPHDAGGALAALGAARAAGVPSLGADLILGLPGEEAARTLEGVARVADAGVDHLSLYLLELHPRTRLGRAAALGRVAPPSDEAAASLYEGAVALLAARGFEQYEISNFARPGHRSRHNLKYWTDAEYVGFGPAAHSYAGGRRYANAADLTGYLEGGGRPRRIEDPGSPARRASEALVLGLRLAEGIDLGRLRERYGSAAPRPDPELVGELERAGLLERSSDRLRLTPRGRLLSNEVFERLLPGGIVPS